jgi:hypothetical protein
VKRWAGYILSIYILLCAVVPCTIVDDCADEQGVAAEAKKDSANSPCGSCSPFSICATSNGVAFEVEEFTLAPIISNYLNQYSEYLVVAKSGYSSSHFQPPRIG